MSNERNSEQAAILREVLSNMRDLAQLTQTQLSKKLERPQSYVSKYESGERKLTFIETREVAISCGFTLTEFVEMFEQELEVQDT